MMFSRIWFPVGLFLLSSSWGCSGMTPSSPASSLPPSSSPYFIPTTEDTIRLAALAPELDTVALECTRGSSCDEVHFSRGLLSLFENRDAARASFERVISTNPSGPFAATSTLWLQLIKDEGVSSPLNDLQRRIFADLATHWVRDWMERQRPASVSQGKRSGGPTLALMQSLHKQVRERDRHIAELRSQLDALKVIDHDQQEKMRKVKAPPAMVVPTTESSR